MTVVFEPELDLLALQARSFDRFLDPDFAGRILVIVNDLRCGAVCAKIESSVKPQYGRWRERVAVVPFHAIAYRLDPTNGWIVQQALKLSCAGLLSARHYVVFDAKNHLVAATSLQRFVDADGVALQMLEPGGRHLPRHQETCTTYFGLGATDLSRPRFVPMTPFVFHTHSVRELTGYIERREGHSLSDFFCGRRCMSEFLLYDAYLETCDGRARHLYRHVAGGIVTIWPGDDVVAAITKADDYEAFCFGVHRNQLAGIGNEELDVLEAYWRRSGLLMPHERFGGIATRHRSANL